jgi:hypothetical protein
MSPSLPHVVAFDAAILLDLGVELVLPSVMLLGILPVGEGTREARDARRTGGPCPPGVRAVAYRLISLAG